VQAIAFVAPKERSMADDTLKRGKPDRSKMNMSEDYEVQY
jgi:hypothetical protein